MPFCILCTLCVSLAARVMCTSMQYIGLKRGNACQGLTLGLRAISLTESNPDTSRDHLRYDSNI